MKSIREIQPYPNFIWPLLLFCLLWLFLLAKQSHAQQVSEQPVPAHLDTAISYFGYHDLPGKNNQGEHIDRWLASVGLPTGNPYCAAFVSYCLDAGNVNRPRVRSGLSSHFIKDNSISAKHVVQGRKQIPPGYIAVWRRGNTQFGHVGFVLLSWRGATGITIEGNTTTGTGGNEFNGSGVWIRERTIYPLNHFRITHFTPVN